MMDMPFNYGSILTSILPYLARVRQNQLVQRPPQMAPAAFPQSNAPIPESMGQEEAPEEDREMPYNLSPGYYSLGQQNQQDPRMRNRF